MDTRVISAYNEIQAIDDKRQQRETDAYDKK